MPFASTPAGGRQPEGVVTASQIYSAHRLHNASLAPGRKRMKLLYRTTVDDLPWAEIGKRLGLSTKTATCRVVEAIAAFALAPVTRLRIEPGRW